MSTKRGRRNGKWHKEKANRRLQQKRDDLWEQSRKVEYEPLEKPIFAGWDVVMEINCVRRDADELQAVADVMKWSEDFYVRDVKKIKLIRRYGKTYQAYIKLKSEYYRFSNFIREGTYLKLPERIQKYFEKHTHHRADTIYTVIWNFPFYAFSLRIKKSFYYYKKVYDSVAKSEHDKLDAALYIEDRKMWGKRWRDDYVKSNKAAWKGTLRNIVKDKLTPDEVIDNYSKIFRNVDNKRDYGWT